MKYWDQLAKIATTRESIHIFTRICGSQTEAYCFINEAIYLFPRDTIYEAIGSLIKELHPDILPNGYMSTEDIGIEVITGRWIEVTVIHESR